MDNIKRTLLSMSLSTILVSGIFTYVKADDSSHKPWFDFRKKENVVKIEKEAKTAEGKAPKQRVKFIRASTLKQTKTGIEDYTMEADDLLEINVWQVEELQKDDIVVRPDGKISFPLIGDVLAEGKTVNTLREDITEKLKLYIKAPQVSVMLRDFGGKNAVVLREGGSGGLIRFTRPITIMEALSLGGGISTESDTDRIFVIREGFTDYPTIILVDARSIYREANLSENIAIKAGDIIYIPRSFIHDFKYFMDTFFGPIMEYTKTYYGDTWRRKKVDKWVHRSQM